MPVSPTLELVGPCTVRALVRTCVRLGSWQANNQQHQQGPHPKRKSVPGLNASARTASSTNCTTCVAHPAVTWTHNTKQEGGTVCHHQELTCTCANHQWFKCPPAIVTLSHLLCKDREIQELLGWREGKPGAGVEMRSGARSTSCPAQDRSFRAAPRAQPRPPCPHATYTPTISRLGYGSGFWDKACG